MKRILLLLVFIPFCTICFSQEKAELGTFQFQLKNEKYIDGIESIISDDLLIEIESLRHEVKYTFIELNDNLSIKIFPKTSIEQGIRYPLIIIEQ